MSGAELLSELREWAEEGMPVSESVACSVELRLPMTCVNARALLLINRTSVDPSMLGGPTGQG